MARKKRTDYDDKISHSGRDFSELMRSIPEKVFVGMVSKSGMPTPEARELCQAFRELKQ